MAESRDWNVFSFASFYFLLYFNLKSWKKEKNKKFFVLI